MIATLAAVALAMLAPQQTWSVGVEREVDEGVYMKVVAAQQGWRVWRIETRNGVQCRAYKSAQGRRHPVPAGVSTMMARSGTPFLEVSWSDYAKKFQAEWHTVNFRGRFEYRAPGERFWNSGAPDPVTAAEQIVEVVAKSWEYPEILVGYTEERANFDLTGIGWAQTAIQACRDAG